MRLQQEPTCEQHGDSTQFLYRTGADILVFLLLYSYHFKREHFSSCHFGIKLMHRACEENVSDPFWQILLQFRLKTIQSQQIPAGRGKKTKIDRSIFL